VRICGLAHRLDRTTSGVIIAARSQQMWEYLRGEFKARRVEKEYRAIVYGYVAQERGRIVAEIVRTYPWTIARLTPEPSGLRIDKTVAAPAAGGATFAATTVVPASAVVTKKTWLRVVGSLNRLRPSVTTSAPVSDTRKVSSYVESARGVRPI
jgi:hypothetical protein